MENDPVTPLQQEKPTPLTTYPINDLLTGLVTIITGIPPALARPRWQPVPPQQPPADVTWCAIGIVARPADGYTHDEMTTLPWNMQEAYLQKRWGSLEVLASFYGPEAGDYAEQFRDGLNININLRTIYKHGIKYTKCDDVLAVPDLVNQQWIDHYDLRCYFTRQINRYYPMESVNRVLATETSDIPSISEKLDSNVAAPGGKPPTPQRFC